MFTFHIYTSSYSCIRFITHTHLYVYSIKYMYVLEKSPSLCNAHIFMTIPISFTDWSNTIQAHHYIVVVGAAAVAAFFVLSPVLCLWSYYMLFYSSQYNRTLWVGTEIIFILYVKIWFVLLFLLLFAFLLSYLFFFVHF